MSAVVQHEPQASRFTLQMEDQQAVLDYQLREGRMLITHTGVPAALRNQGLARQLTRAAMALAAEQGLKVVPVCSYAASFLRRNPEYAALVE